MKTNKAVQAIGFSRMNKRGDYQLNLKINQDNFPLVKALAIKYDVPIVRNPALIKALQDLPTNYDLPKELIPILDIILSQIENDN